MSTYDPLWEYIGKRGETEFVLSFREIAGILGFEIDHSFLTFKKELAAYGYEIGKISLKEKSLRVKRLAG